MGTNWGSNLRCAWVSMSAKGEKNPENWYSKQWWGKKNKKIAPESIYLKLGSGAMFTMDQIQNT